MITRIEANRIPLSLRTGCRGSLRRDRRDGGLRQVGSAGYRGPAGRPSPASAGLASYGGGSSAGKTRRTGTLLELLHRQDGDRIFFVVEANLSSNHVGALAGTDPAGLVMPVPTRLRHAARVDVGRRTFEITDDSMLLINGRRDRLSDEFFGAAALGEASEKDALEPKVRQLVAARQQHWGPASLRARRPRRRRHHPSRSHRIVFRPTTSRPAGSFRMHPGSRSCCLRKWPPQPRTGKRFSTLPVQTIQSSWDGQGRTFGGSCWRCRRMTRTSPPHGATMFGWSPSSEHSWSRWV